jgi:hypothetical protein
VTRPRFTLLGMMGLVGLIAVNTAVLRWLFLLDPATPAIFMGMAVVAPLNLLFIGLVRMSRQLARSGECGPFSVGFQALGWPATLGFALSSLAALDGNRGWLGQYVELVAAPLRSTIEASGSAAWFEAHPVLAIAFEVLFFVMLLGGPWLILPVIGGLVFRKLGITLVRRQPALHTTPNRALRRSAAAATASSDV